MCSITHHRPLLIATLTAFALGLGCAKRSGLDRGDANEGVLGRAGRQGSAEPASRNAAETNDDTAEFAQPPGTTNDAYESMRAAPEPSPAAPAEMTNHGSGQAAPAKAAPTSAAKARVSSADLSPRGRDAYKPERESYPAREERPGLGTSFGESRRSRVSSVNFERDKPNAPTAIARIFYNDSRGIAAQTGERDVASFVPNLTEMGRGFVTVEIVDADGLALAGVSVAGNSYVVGRDGDRYSIRVQNHERHRIEVVATVDGLDVVDGATASYQKRGYVIEPYSSLTIEGFRRSTNAVASFRFGAVSDSYAATTGSDRNVGVIGVAYFAERGCCTEEYPNGEVYRRQSADPFPGRFATPPPPRPRYRAD